MGFDNTQRKAMGTSLKIAAIPLHSMRLRNS